MEIFTILEMGKCYTSVFGSVFFRECIGNCLLTFLELENLSKSCQHDDWIQFDRSFLLLSANS